MPKELPGWSLSDYNDFQSGVERGHPIYNFISGLINKRRLKRANAHEYQEVNEPWADINGNVYTLPEVLNMPESEQLDFLKKVYKKDVPPEDIIKAIAGIWTGDVDRIEKIASGR